MTRSFVLLACAACGRSTAAPMDASDAAMADAALLDCSPFADQDVVKLTFTAYNGHVAGVPVVYQNADSSLVGVALTDTNGTACGKIDPGGFVTVIPPTYELVSFAAVKPGDHLFVGPVLPPKQPPPPPTTISFALTFTPDPAGGVTDYAVRTTCGGGVFSSAATGALTLAGCGGTADFLILSEGPTGLLDESYVSGVAVADGQPVSLTTSYVPVPTTMYTYTNQFFANPITFDYSLRTQRGLLWEGEVQLPMNQLSAAVHAPAVAGETCVVHSRVTSNGTRSANGDVIDWGPCGTSYDLDVAVALFREQSGPTGPTFDPAANAVVWTESTTGAVPDVVVASLVAETPGLPGLDWVWVLAAPRGADPRVVFPKLPPSVFMPNPSDYPPSAVGDVSFSMGVISVSMPGGYDAFRAIPLDMSRIPDYAAYISGTSGRIVYSGYY
jgi:hypothetical protein